MNFSDIKPTISNQPLLVKTSLDGNIKFNKVNFVYPHTGIHALKDFSQEIKKGEKVAIVGRTGSGKSTVAQLLLRMYDVSEGSIEIDGSNIRQIDLSLLREQISYVPQDVFLFSETIENNIGFGMNHFTRSDVEKAAIRASVEKEIAGFSEQYDTMIGERGVTLSGGQKQRISIARALIKDPGIVVFDDCLSAVDARTEREILTSLNEYLLEKTAIIFTHRIFSMLSFDKVIVLEDGRIIEQGTHEQLLRQEGYYATLYKKQQQQDKATLAPRFSIEPRLALAIATTESNFASNALSPKNAMAVMQLIPETASRFNVKNSFDPVDNIKGGLPYLRWLLAYYRGNVALAVAGYNAGEGAVDRYKGVPPYKETQNYVPRILEFFPRTEHPFDAGVAAASPALQALKSVKP